jgi:hypothetical protein
MMEENKSPSTIDVVIDLAAWVVEENAVICGACAFWTRWADKLTVTTLGSCGMAKTQAQGYPAHQAGCQHFSWREPGEMERQALERIDKIRSAMKQTPDRFEKHPSGVILEHKGKRILYVLPCA